MARSSLNHAIDLAQQHPEETNTIAGHTGNFAQAASAMAGDGRLGAGLGGVGNLAGGASNLVSAYSNLSQGNIAAGLGDAAAGTGNFLSMMPSLAQHAPIIGGVTGAAQTVGHGMEAYKHRDKVNDAYAGNPFWTEAGASTLSAVNTAAALDPTGFSTFATTGAQAAIDGAGMASGYLGKKLLNTDTSFTAASTVGTAGHMAYDTVSNMYSAGKWGLGKLWEGGSWLAENMPSG